MTALVVDDDATARYILKHAVSRHPGWDVVEAEDGMAGLRALEASPVDLVLLDVQMPTMDGLAMLRAMRASPRHARLPVVMLTGAGEEYIVRSALTLGVLDYLLKPLTEDALTVRLERVLRAPACGGAGTA
jgi:DNA-binding response OmpR family regulator